jgi:ribosomal-protein-alanine N-acetyltransferase
MEARVRISPPTPADAEEFITAMRASRNLHRPWNYAPETEAGYRAWLERLGDPRHDPALIRRRSDDALVGYVNLSEIIRGNFQSAFIGYAAVARHAGQGYMAEGVSLVLDRGFDELGLHRVEANIQPGNERSIALVRRLGFVHEGLAHDYLQIGGRWCDHEHWAMRAELWATRTSRAPG